MDVVDSGSIAFGGVRRRVRHSPLGPAFMSLVLLAICAGGGHVLARVFGGPGAPPWWLTVLVSPVVFVVGGLILLATWGAVSLFLASLRATNWSVLALDTGLWINLRSYANHHFPADTARAAFVPYAEIASARRVTERFPRIARSKRSLPDARWLELTLVHTHTAALHDAVEAERTRVAPERKFLGITSRSRQVHTTCFVLRPGVVRVEWLGGGLLRELEGKVHIDAPLAYEIGGEVEARALEFLRRGDPLSATQLLHVERGLSLRDAKDKLAELDTARRAA